MRPQVHEALNEFKGAECHVVFVKDGTGRLTGMVTKNDLIEQLLQTRFPDERLVRRLSPDHVHRHNPAPPGLYTVADSLYDQEATANATTPLLGPPDRTSPPARYSADRYEDEPTRNVQG